MRADIFIVAAFLALAPAVARAQDLAVEGTLENDGTSLKLAAGRARYLLSADEALVAVLRRAAEVEPKVRARVRVGASVKGLALADLVSIEGRLVADARLQDGVGLGAASAEPVKANDLVQVTAGRRGGTPGSDALWLRVGARPERWIAASLVRLGHDSPLGTWLGDQGASLFAATSRARHARTFHPDGVVYTGTVKGLAPAEPYAALARRLEGSVLARLGVGLAKRKDQPGMIDLPSLAFRLRAANAPLSVEAAAGDQDFTFSAYSERFADFFNPIAIIRANQLDYFDNTYYAAMPFHLEGTDRDVWLRVVPVDPALGDKEPKTHPEREEKLARAAKAGKAVFRLEVQRRTFLSNLNPFADWVPVAELRLERSGTVDQESLHFHPQLNGRGLVAIGRVAGARAAVYRASQDARPKTEAERAKAEGLTRGLAGGK